MTLINLIKLAILEGVFPTDTQRRPEPSLTMDEPEQVIAYSKEGLPGGALMPIYLNYLSMLTRIIQPSDRVIDLGCGSGKLLCLAAQIFPQCHFVGVDLSPAMLNVAEDTIKEQNIKNITFKQSDFTALSARELSSYDVLISCLAIHHLPDFESLKKLLESLKYFVNKGGRIALTDFARPRTRSSIEILYSEQKKVQSPASSIDYLHSLHASFSMMEWLSELRIFKDTAIEVRTIPLVNAMIAITTPLTGTPPQTESLITNWKQSLSKTQLADLRALSFIQWYKAS